MDQAQIQKATEVLKKYNSGIIALQNNPSYDGAAAGLALYLALSKMNKHVSIVCSQVPKYDIVGTDKIQTAFAPSGNHLVISFPYTEGAIDKVDYNITGDTFNLIIAPNSETTKINPKDVKFSYTGGKIDFIITVDVPNLNSLGPIYTENQSEFQGKTIVNIDRHLINNNFGTVNLVNKQISSTSELIYQVIRDLGAEIDKDLATNLYNGILSATNNFSSYSVNQQTFEAAAELMKFGAVKKQLAQPKPPGFGAPPSNFGSPGGFGGGAPMGGPSPSPFGGPGPGFGMGQQPPSQFPYMPPAPGMGGPLMNEDLADPYDDFDDDPLAMPPMVPPPPMQQAPRMSQQHAPMPQQRQPQPMQHMQQQMPPPMPQQPIQHPPAPQPPMARPQPQHSQQRPQQPMQQQVPQQPIQTNQPQSQQEEPPQADQQPGQPQGQQQSRNPQDWLKPKLFRGNNLI